MGARVEKRPVLGWNKSIVVELINQNFKKTRKTKIGNWRDGRKYKIVFHLLSGAFVSRVKIQTQSTTIRILEDLLKWFSRLHSH